MRYLELFGVLYLPALILAILVLESVGVNAQVAFGVAGLMFMGFFMYAAYAKYR